MIFGVLQCFLSLTGATRLIINNIHVLNQHVVHSCGLGPWTDKFEMSNPKGNECHGSSIAVGLDGESGDLLLRHYGAGFVGVFRTSNVVEPLYPPQSLLTAIELHLPSGVNNEGQVVVVEENDILFCVLPHKREWQMKPVDLQGALYGLDASDKDAFAGWAKNIILMLKDSRATILLASIGRESTGYHPQSFNIMYSHDYQASYAKVESKRPSPNCHEVHP